MTAILNLFEHAAPFEVSLPDVVDDVVAPPYDVTPYLAAAHYVEQLSLLSRLRTRELSGCRSVTDVMAVDLFAGGGGASLGIEQATERSPIAAVNHDWHAIQMHMANHPLSIHFHRDVWDVPPSGAVNGARIDLLWASPDCFPAGTLILTVGGLKPIEQVQVGEMVLTHKGRWRRVTWTGSKISETVSVRGHGHYGLVTTPNHPFYSKRITKRYPGAGPDGRRPGTVRTLVENPYWPEAQDMEGKLWATPRTFGDAAVPTCAGAEFSDDFFYFLGRWLGDGSLNKGDAEICCGHAEAADFDRRWAEHPIRRANGEIISPRFRQDESTRRAIWGNADLVRWLRENFGEYCHGKKIPTWLLCVQESWRRAFLDGYVDSDGHDQPELSLISTTSVSKELSIGIRLLATSLGYAPALYFGKGKPGQIDGRAFKGRDQYGVRWRENLQRGTVFWDQIHLFSPVREVTATGRVEQVFTLSVEEDESYTADGIVVHNCTHHSRARGGKPRQKDIRGLAWVIIEWAAQVRPTVIAGENVPEFLGWGPLHPDTPDVPRKLHNCPIKDRMGETFDAFRLALGPGVPEDHPSWGEIPERVREYARRGCGYDLRTAVLKACDYGAPTSRSRLYFVARCDGQPARFPEPTHGPGRAHPWHTAAECLDFEEPSLSIFASPEDARAWARSRKVGLPQRPLAEATMRRIAEGIRRFVLTNADPYIVVTGHQSSDGGKVKPIHGPLSTIMTKAEHCLVTPVVTKFYGTSKAGATVEEPMPTVTAQAGGGHLGVAEAVLAPALMVNTTGNPATSPADPLKTIATGGHHALISPVMEPAEMITPLIMRAHGKGWDKPGKASGVTKPDQPFPTITATEEWSVVSPMLVQSGYGERKGQAPRVLDITKPLGTVVGAGGKHALVSAFMAKHYGGVIGHGLDRALGTVTSIDHHSLVEADLSTTPVQPDRREMVAAFLVLYYGSGGQWQKLDEPMKTIVSKARLGLVEVTLNGVPHVITDIRMRMLTPRELARAQGFPDSYILTGTKAQQIARIGNSVCPPVARAIVEANFGPRAAPTLAA